MYLIFPFPNILDILKFLHCKNSTSLMHLIFCCWKDWQLQTRALRNVLLRKLSSEKNVGKREQLLMTLLFTKRKLLYQITRKELLQKYFYLVVKHSEWTSVIQLQILLYCCDDSTTRVNLKGFLVLDECLLNNTLRLSW